MTLSTNNQPVPYYNHFLFKESLDLKLSLITFSKKYKTISVQLKETLKNLQKLKGMDLGLSTIEKLENFVSILEAFKINLKTTDNTLFNLQKDLQSNKVYDEDYQKSIRIECKMLLDKMESLLIDVNSHLSESFIFLAQISEFVLPEKTTNWLPIDFINILQGLVSTEKRLIR